jgi:hypothetical protein
MLAISIATWSAHNKRWEGQKGTPETAHVGPKFIDGHPVLDESGNPVMWFWDQDPSESVGYRDVAIFSGVVTSEDLLSIAGLRMKEVYFYSATLPFGNFVINSDIVRFEGLCQSLFTGSCNIIVQRGDVSGLAGGNELRDVTIEIAPGSSKVKVSELLFTTQTPSLYWSDPNNRGSAIKLAGDLGAIRNCEIRNNTSRYRSSTYAAINCFDCLFTGNVCEAGYWSFLVVSASRCKFVSETSIGGIVLGSVRPVVGFLNMARASHVAESPVHLVENTYEDIKIDGWKEEGFSFDEGPDSMFFIGTRTCSSISSEAITLHEPIECAVGDIISFISGPASGDWFVIKSVSGSAINIDGAWMGDSSEYIGSTVLVEKPCYGNEVKKIQCIAGGGTAAGIVFWGHGGRTKLADFTIKGALLRLMSVANDSGTVLIPSGVRVDGAKITGNGAGFGIRTDISYIGDDLQKKANQIQYGISDLRITNTDARVLYNTVKNAQTDGLKHKDTIVGKPTDAPTFSRRNRVTLAQTYSQRTEFAPYLGQQSILLGNDGVYSATQVWTGSAWRSL